MVDIAVRLVTKSDACRLAMWILAGWEADDTAAGDADNNKAKCLSLNS